MRLKACIPVTENWKRQRSVFPSDHALLKVRKSVFAIFIGLGAEITGKILKKHLTFSKNIIEMIRLSYNFSKTEIRVLKALYLAAFEATKKWSPPIHNWGQTCGEMCIMYEGRLPY